MLIKLQTGLEIPSSQITPEALYLSRRKFIKGAAAVAAGTLLVGCRPERPPQTEEPVSAGTSDQGNIATTVPQTTSSTDELGNTVNTFEEITNYNNYYEFTTDKRGVAYMASDFKSSPWTVQVGGLVNKPGIYDLDRIRTGFDQEERIYRLRCVEAWSMVIPWQGFPLRKLLEQVEPTAEAKYVRFETIYDPEQLPGQKISWYSWPYIEGLRLDEAMNDLTILATGLYGKDLPPQNGAPVRLVVPWKYGFKSIKSIVKIDLVDSMPISLWMDAASNEYGFYANVNPDVDHPRWSQASERIIGGGRKETLLFNGYEAQVTSLYAGMDLRRNF